MSKKSLLIPAILFAMALVLAACSAAAPETTVEATQEATEAAATEPAATEEAATEAATEVASPVSLEDTGTVFVMGPSRGTDADRFEAVIAAFEADNPDINVIYTGTSEFEALIHVRVEAGDPPDVGMIPQPGLMKKFADDGAIVPLWPEAVALVDQNYSPAWKDLGSYEGTPYGVFHRVNAKGWIWYNKPRFEAAGYEVPQTWEELQALTSDMVNSGTSPWCIGIESGAATGWVGTDWLENIMLRTQPVETYDQWISHELLFDSPEVRQAWSIMDTIWADPELVYGGAPTIATTSYDTAPRGLFGDEPNCWLHMQGSFVTGWFPEDVQADLDNQVGVFMMPPIDPALPVTLEVGGDQFVVFTGHDRPEVRRFVEFLATGASATPWASLGGALFPHRDQDTSVYPTQIEQTMVQTLLTAEAARFDASDSMLSAGNTAFWRGVTDYVSGKPIDDVLREIDAGFSE